MLCFAGGKILCVSMCTCTHTHTHTHTHKHSAVLSLQVFRDSGKCQLNPPEFREKTHPPGQEPVKRHLCKLHLQAGDWATITVPTAPPWGCRPRSLRGGCFMAPEFWGGRQFQAKPGRSERERGVPRQHSRLRIWCGHCCGGGLIPGLGRSACHGRAPPP